MKDSDQSSKIAGIVVAMLTMLLGYGYLHVNWENPRPEAPRTGIEVPTPASTHQVVSRLWQDPFECFEASTNPAAVENDNGAATSTGAGGASGSTNLWGEITGHEPGRSSQDEGSTGQRTVILGVMLEGGPYADEKEVRLRTRYAVLMALLTPSNVRKYVTADFRPEDRSHIYTNSLRLTTSDGDTAGVASQYAYEWFQTLNPTNSYGCTSWNRICVLWLNEDDFGDSPALRLGSLLGQIPPVVAGDTNTSFYLVGPRASDTLRALANTPTTGASLNYSYLKSAATKGTFQILSPESTACIAQDNVGDADDAIITGDLTQVLGTNVFHNWIATDQQIASLISEELTNRLNTAGPKSNNVVVLLSEQDTYFGSKVADEWTAALADRVCGSWGSVWQYAYLRGLDGSKPQAETEQASSTDDPADGTGKSEVQYQQKGQQADGDAQLDYAARLADFLTEQSRVLKQENGGRIVAIGFTGSDAYDKLMLLQQLRPRFPEAIFFTTDLDATLWTTKELKYTRGLLVGSAYPVDPEIADNFQQNLEEEYAPFRDVYQTAVYRAVCRVVENQLFTSTNYDLDAPAQYLAGGLYVIGRHGPVRLGVGNPDAEASYLLPPDAWSPCVPLISMAVCMAGWLILFFATANGGVRSNEDNTGSPHQDRRPIDIRKAENLERGRQISKGQLQFALGSVLVVGIVTALFQYAAARTAARAWEEPWNFTEGVSIWPTEWLRLAAVMGAGIFIAAANYRRKKHRKKLWMEYFREGDACSEPHLTWERFFKICKHRWRADLREKDKRKIVRRDMRRQQKLAATNPGYQLQTKEEMEYELEHERQASLILGWTPPFIGVEIEGKRGVWVNAAAIFRCYLHLGLGGRRALRAVGGTLIYFILVIMAILFLNEIPATSFIRGDGSRFFDMFMTLITVLATLYALFYVFDAALLTKRVLDYLSRHPTHWPETPLRRNAVKFGLRRRHLDSLLDVEFAAVQTNEISPLMFGPLLMILLLLISRSPFLDNWTWPPALVAIFVLNFLLVVFYWWMVRRATENVRQDSLERLAVVRSSVDNSEDKEYTILVSENRVAPECIESPENKATVKDKAPAENTIIVKREQYVKNLDAVIERIRGEKRGAFAVWFQDPAYLAVGIPSGITGIISLIGSLWMNK
jgi:hypothetical protein